MPTTRVMDRIDKDECLLMDGGTGSEIQRRGVEVLLGRRGDELGPWSATANIEAADVVQQVHQDYLRVGADVIISNNFRTSRIRLDAVGLGDRWQQFARAAGENAIRARNAINPEAYVAGGMAGLAGADELTIGKRAYLKEFSEQALLLAKLGVDVMLPEYMGRVEESVEAVDTCAEAGLPVWLGVHHVTAEGQLHYGESLQDLVSALRGHPVDAILLMCSSPANITACLPVLRSVYDGPIGAYPNIGYNPMAMVGGRTADGGDILSAAADSPSRLAEVAAEWKEMGAQIIGGCCGTGPEHIMAMKQVVKDG